MQSQDYSNQCSMYLESNKFQFTVWCERSIKDMFSLLPAVISKGNHLHETVFCQWVLAEERGEVRCLTISSVSLMVTDWILNFLKILCKGHIKAYILCTFKNACWIQITICKMVEILKGQILLSWVLKNVLSVKHS